ncbi:MAG: NADH-quinone oxidoreductase subunit L, partial [Micrococcales bacterium]|nr:NADH-quinone oxidoreductase subunit L [Micrococcales bacterium]
GIATALNALARLVFTLDRDVVDAYPRAAAASARTLGRVGQRAHRAVPSLALLGLVIGVVLLAVSASWWR